MSQVNMLEAKTRLSQLVAEVESGAQAEIVIARNGKPAARIVPIAPRQKIRFGLMKDVWPPMPADPHADDEYIDRLFYGDPEEA